MPAWPRSSAVYFDVNVLIQGTSRTGTWFAQLCNGAVRAWECGSVGRVLDWHAQDPGSIPSTAETGSGGV